MRLTQIKLSGFKSFVDTTVIPTPSQRVGVVGPNGCGKSNIIDAVRWVLGESRASELRGGTMQDVIFNGSAQRKPAGRASVELTFDNHQGRVQGQWGAYTEISVRRELSRDGASGYFINGQQVRRRDINDMFLGTGLGSRGYAIIGQGMINRLIEAKPEELRVYLEEAAGVSKYKERRRETESRLRDTRENLQRLEDILQELEQQLVRLEDQAQVAQQYQALQAEGEQKQHLLWWLRESAARQEQQQHFLAIEQAQTAVEAALADTRTVESRLEQLRVQHAAQTDAVQVAQGHMYEGSARVSRIEAEIQHAQTAQTRLLQRQQQLEAQQKEWQQLHGESAQELEQKQQEIEEVVLSIDELEARLEELAYQLTPVQDQYQRVQQQVERCQFQWQQAQQQQALAAQRLQSLEQQSSQLTQRAQRFEQQLSQLAHHKDGLEQAKEQLTTQQQRHEQLALQHKQLQAQQQQAQQQAQQHERALTQEQAQLDALQYLQQQVQKQGRLPQWLAEQGLADTAQLWQQLQVEPGWERAVEAVLGQRLQALLLSDWQQLPRNVTDLPARAWFLHAEVALEAPQAKSSQALMTKVQVLDEALQPLVAWLLAGYETVTDWHVALQQAEQASDTAFVVAQGHIAQAHQVLFYAEDTEQVGMLARQQHIEQLAQQVQLFTQRSTEATQQAVQAKEALEQSQTALELSQVALTGLTQQVHEQQLQYQQAQQLQQELVEIAVQQEQYAQSTELSAEQLEQAEQAVEELEAQQHELRAQSNELQQRLSLLNEQGGQLQQQHQQAQHNQHLLQLRIEELLRSQQQATDLGQRAQMELAGLAHEQEDVDIISLQQDLQEALEQRVLLEEALHTQQKQLAVLSEELQQLESEKGQHTDRVEPLRQKVVELQLAEQASRLAVEQFAEQLDAQQVNRQALAELVVDQPKEWRSLTWLQSERQRINRAISALGAVNLAALEELKTAQERQFYLQSQHDDLNEAIQTLEGAIHKIDRETRALLQSTFNAVNAHFGELFPQLFGGGEAKLLLTGEELLEAGVQVMAQPPGKRNSSIQLLSGGEKALTATALVFAFFKLNPAPFCLLDEVDAPLDDANTERYTQLVKSMSHQTQFLFISHNKIAMQMAKQLVGVTMQEQGVSRIVAVDMAAAVEMMH